MNLLAQNNSQTLVGDGTSDNIELIAVDNAGQDTMQPTYGGMVSIGLNLSYNDNTLTGGNGDDQLYGDFQSFTIKLQGGSNPFSGSDASVILAYSTITFGNDHLYGGNGNDLICGDVGDMNIQLIGGSDVHQSNTSAGAYLINTAIVFGNDVLDGGNGNDILIGDA